MDFLAQQIHTKTESSYHAYIFLILSKLGILSIEIVLSGKSLNICWLVLIVLTKGCIDRLCVFSGWRSCWRIFLYFYYWWSSCCRSWNYSWIWSCHYSGAWSWILHIANIRGMYERKVRLHSLFLPYLK